MTIIRNGVPMYPTDSIRLVHLDRVCKKLKKRLGIPLNIIEIGSLLGESAKVLAKYGRVLCIDTWDYEDGLATFGRNTQHLSISCMQGSSVDILPTLPTNEYDLAYVDGDHTYPVVLSDMQQAQRIVSSNGIVCGDDLEKQDSDSAYENRFHDFINDYHPGVTAAVKEVFGTVNMVDGFWWTKNA